MLDLEAVKARAEAAFSAEGWHGEIASEWHVVARGGANREWDPQIGYDVDGIEEPDVRGQFAHRAVAEFIAHSREDVLALYTEVERLRAERDARGNDCVEQRPSHYRALRTRRGF